MDLPNFPGWKLDDPVEPPPHKKARVVSETLPGIWADESFPGWPCPTSPSMGAMEETPLWGITYGMEEKAEDAQWPTIEDDIIVESLRQQTRNRLTGTQQNIYMGML